ncbi:MAG: di-heme oxidoredictase family protein [Pseudomonadota bacterium]
MSDIATGSQPPPTRWGALRFAVLLFLLTASAAAFGVQLWQRAYVPALGADDAAMDRIRAADPRTLLADDLSSFRYDDQAYTVEAPNLDWRLSFAFDEGDGHIERFFQTATPSSLGTNNDGLGPIYNAASCESCHQFNGRTKPLPGQGLLMRLSVPGEAENGGPKPHPVYGGQFGDVSHEAMTGVKAEGAVEIVYDPVPGTYGDGTPYELRKPIYSVVGLNYGPMGDDVMVSPRAPLSLYGLGLLEAISDETLLSWADPDDLDGDGISGKVNRVHDAATGETAIGRFGWKAEQPSLIAQSADAALNDMGITTSLFPHETCMDAQAGCRAALNGAEDDGPEFDDESLIEMAAYMQFLAVPARGHIDHPDVRRGEALFSEIGCAACHKPHAVTGQDHEYRRLRGKTVRAYTDLLLHDMGEALSDGRPSFDAEGREWRTPPLWGLGLLETVNGHVDLMHDGRARGFEEAILWHGGEAKGSRERFRAMTSVDREALVKFLKSL